MSQIKDTVKDILDLFGLTEITNEALSLLNQTDFKYLRDLKLNFNSTLTSEHLSEKECGLIGLSVAANNQNAILIKYYTKYSLESGATEEEISEAVSCASLLASNNVFYRFRHFTQKERYGQIPARIRMQLMMKPITGKEFFELLSLAISAVNGCELCVNAHEDSLIKLGSSEERIFDAVRIASIVTATGKVIY
ncbi:alkylhydroperoxidase like protein, AhpD family [Pseudopedobacter saltans DSM 12145]|uniref:Alkyl hydroperoxide reductase AhpD n=1 Tax=Pseudopedobacter saltans (strain ATCC 51119 / DSM 12145 / JCM 21818 / CCUG 39354 / LMG 10337 / NBRC 100064 / NCIMB 13643) TaxID=762903 RepID=F0S8W3_PSESL|nr:carboxymuconolactone decarboxylase family protein [Pseudopedobacter saltans]ADY53450.1 alkylhydroperoxidase like protein, AhpD family [Pseudopedobacter saltans DSM 12145]